jgi:hypothetical protein
MNARPPVDIQVLRKAERMLRIVRGTLDPAVPAHHIQAFLAVAAKEGQTLDELSEGLGSDPLSTSRFLLELGNPSQGEAPRYRLVKAQADRVDSQVQRYSLTQRGKLLARTVSDVLAE